MAALHEACPALVRAPAVPSWGMGLHWPVLRSPPWAQAQALEPGPLDLLILCKGWQGYRGLVPARQHLPWLLPPPSSLLCQLWLRPVGPGAWGKSLPLSPVLPHFFPHHGTLVPQPSLVPSVPHRLICWRVWVQLILGCPLLQKVITLKSLETTVVDIYLVSHEKGTLVPSNQGEQLFTS